MVPPQPPTGQPITVRPSSPQRRNMHRDVFANQPVETRHRCAGCGRYRSPSFHHRHPIQYGLSPTFGVCRKCQYMQTSSDESTDDGHPSRKRRREKKKATGEKDEPIAKKKNCIHYRHDDASSQTRTCPTSSQTKQDTDCSPDEYSCTHLKKPCDTHRCCHDNGLPRRERHIHHALYADKSPQAMHYDNIHLYPQPPFGRTAHRPVPGAVDEYSVPFYSPQNL